MLSPQRMHLRWVLSARCSVAKQTRPHNLSVRVGVCCLRIDTPPMLHGLSEFPADLAERGSQLLSLRTATALLCVVMGVADQCLPGVLVRVERHGVLRFGAADLRA